MGTTANLGTDNKVKMSTALGSFRRSLKKMRLFIAKSKREEKSIELANQILENYQPKTVDDMQNAL